jgi:carboxymethylenebutenolidase
MALKNYIVEEVALDCADGLLTRREALRRLGLMGLTGAAAAALLAACGDDDEEAATTSGAATTQPVSAAPITSPPPAAATTTQAVPLSSPGGASTSPTPTTAAPAVPAAPPTGEEIRFNGPNGELIGVVAEAASPSGAVLVIHENRGLTEHIRSIPPRLAADGYTALAIDLLSEEGGTAGMPSEGDATAALGNAPTDRMIADLRAGLDELARRAPGAKLAVIGFCFGGGMTWQLVAAGEPRLEAAVPFYGPFPSGSDLSGSPNAAVLGIYAGEDSRVNGSMDAAEQALTAAGLTHELRVFEGVDHAFFNDTGQRYDADAAAEAYQEMLDWFGQHLAA